MTAVARERVHAMESLAAIIAHELRPGVLGVTSAAQLLRYSTPQDPVAEKSLGRILQEAERLAALHEALTEYATSLPPNFSTGHPDRVWTDALRAMRGLVETAGVQVTHSASDPVRVRLDAEQLGRAFERALSHALSRVQAGAGAGAGPATGAQVDIVSSVQGSWWECTISSEAPTRPLDRPGISYVLGQRTLLAHGGELVDQDPAAAPLLVSIRLPLSLEPE